MGKEMKSNWKVWCLSLHKHNYLIIKLGVSILLLALAFRLLFSRSTDFSTVSDSPFLDKTTVTSTIHPVSASFPQPIHHLPLKGNAEKCDIFNGSWVPNSVGPTYTNESCPLIENHQNCMKNGRPDTEYLYWKWKPRDCDLPQFNAKRFLELMRNKAWALIGDSITRNHVQSLLCILSQVDPAIEVYHDEEYKSRRWHFSTYNLSISVLWSPFLAEAAIFEDINGVSSKEIEIHLDRLDSNWTKIYQNLDYIIFSSGKWFIKTAKYYENTTILGCHRCSDKNLTELGFGFAYRKILQQVFGFIISSNHKGKIFYRTATPDHFENGEWYDGGSCRRTEPVQGGVFKLNELNRILRAIELEEFEKSSVKAIEKGVDFKLLDVTTLSLLRPDGHPGPYRHFQPFAKNKDEKIINDCLHWCLPGPIDTWNDLVMEMLVNG